MTSVEIAYCVPCGHLDRARSLQEEILSTYGQELDSVALATGDSGIFQVHVDDELLFDKENEEYDPDALVDRVGDLT